MDRIRGQDTCEDFDLSAGELREVTFFALAAAREVLSIFEDERPDDPRPRLAIEAAQLVVDGAPRSRLQRLAAPAAHRAAKDASSPAARHAALAAGDAGASMYLHPLARASQVNHILRAPAHAACVWEYLEPHRSDSAEAALQRAVLRATPELIAVLNRYPSVPHSKDRVSQYVAHLQTSIRDQRPHDELLKGSKP